MGSEPAPVPAGVAELRKFDLASFPAPAGGDLSVTAERVFSPPSLELRQVDNAWSQVEVPEEEASKLIVNGFIEPIVKELPMEYAVEMNRLIELQMEGSIG